jgi:hypothetical protein
LETVGTGGTGIAASATLVAWSMGTGNGSMEGKSDGQQRIRLTCSLSNCSIVQGGQNNFSVEGLQANGRGITITVFIAFGVYKIKVNLI